MFSTEGLVIRPYAPGDDTALYEAVRGSLDTVGPWMSWCHPGYSPSDAENYVAACTIAWRHGSDRDFGVFHAASGELLGSVGINQHNRINNFANLGYWVRAGRTGRGIASAAARLAAAYAFRDLGLARLEVVVRPDNAASRRVAEKLGARFEGIARHRLLYRGVSHDAAMYALLPGDLAA